MALIDPNQTRRIDLPHEEGAWVDVRPITARDFATIQRDTKGESHSEVTLRFLAHCVVAWSYDLPVTAQNIDHLDVETLLYLDEQINLTSGFLSDSEKKESEPPSSPTSDQDAEVSLTSSPT